MAGDTYSRAYRARLTKRLTGPNSIRPAKLAEQTGVSQATLYRWKQKAESAPPVAPRKPKKRSRKSKAKKVWPLADKLRILSESNGLPDSELGAFLRKEGVHPDQLQVWRDALDESPSSGGSAARRRIKELERELRRKDKALAEAAALLVLQKKMREILADEDGYTDESSEDGL
jgi:transposase